MTEQRSETMVDLSCQPLCHACSGETRVIYVHLCSGTVLKVANANGVTVTQDEIIIPCGDGQAVEFQRSEVYFTSCEKLIPPFPS